MIVDISNIGKYKEKKLMDIVLYIITNTYTKLMRWDIFSLINNYLIITDAKETIAKYNYNCSYFIRTNGVGENLSSCIK